jgi:ribosomal-protein-alanine N-acetyltransferase
VSPPETPAAGEPGAVTTPGPLAYRRLAREHIPLVLPIEHEAYPDPWTQGMFLQEIRNGTSHFYLGFAGEALIAYGGFWIILDEVHITKLTVSASCRGQGHGAGLLAFLEQAGKAAGGHVVRLEVRESNEIARALYREAGYEEVGLRKRYYAASGEDAVVMVKALLPPSENRG